MRVERNKETRLSGTEPDAFVGRTFDGFRVEERIGAGGMGVVYKATQLSLDRSVAIKVLPESLAKNETFLDRFHREADLLSRLSHPNVVAIIDRGEVDSRAYVVMEYVDGQSLREIMKRGPLPPNESLAIVRSVLSALEHAHEKGIVHRDVKPENVLIAPGGVVKVADFGLARLLDPADVTRLTRTHTLLGTYEYMAPEQRERVKEADERSDIYATGVLLYEMIAGELPIGRFEPLSAKHAECDARLDDVVSRSLEKNPARRYQRAVDMADAVSRVLDAEAPRESTKTRLLQLVSDRMRFDPLQFAQRLNLLATFTNILAFGFGVGAAAWAIAAIAGGAITSNDAIQSAVYALPAMCLGMMAWYCMETASKLRQFHSGARKAQGILALACAPTGILLPYSVFSWWLLHSFRGAAYYDARARGLSADQAITTLSHTDTDPDAPLKPKTSPPPPATGHLDWTNWMLAALGAGAVMLGLYALEPHPSDEELAVVILAAAGSFWAFLGMPKVYRRTANGPVFAFAGILTFTVVMILGVVNVHETKQSLYYSNQFRTTSVPVLRLPKNTAYPLGLAEDALSNTANLAWIRAVAQPDWNFPGGIHFEWRDHYTNQPELRVHFDRHHTGRRRRGFQLANSEARVAMAIAELLRAHLPESELVAVSMGTAWQRQQFQVRMKRNPMPEWKR